MRPGDRAAMATVAVLAMWPFIVLNFIGWLALWHWNMVPFNTWTVLVSTWPVGIDLIILRVGLIQAAQSAEALSEIRVLARGMTTLLRQGESRDQKIVAILERLEPVVEDIAEAHGTEVEVDG